MMKKYLHIAILGAALSLANTHAALIWSLPTNISGDTDVSTLGSLEYAYYFAFNRGPSTVTVNTVTFAQFSLTGWTATPISIGGGNITVTASVGQAAPSFGSSASNPFASLSQGYQDILADQLFSYDQGDPGGDTTLTLQLNNLTIGSTYLVQFWANESRSGAVAERTGRITSSGQSVDMDYNTTNSEGGLGQWATASFTATAASQSFVFEGTTTGDNVPLVNAMQLRTVAEIPEPGTWAAAALLALTAGYAGWRRRAKITAP